MTPAEMSNAVAVAMTEAVEADRLQVSEIIDLRVLVNPEFRQLEAPFIVGGEPDHPTLGALGLINGALQICGSNRIAAHYDDEGHLTAFFPCDPDGKALPRK